MYEIDFMNSDGSVTNFYVKTKKAMEIVKAKFDNIIIRKVLKKDLNQHAQLLDL